MITVIGITQFVFLSLGIMAVNILIKVGTSKPNEHPPLSQFLYQYGPWLFLIPVLWVLLAGLIAKSDSKALQLFAKVFGILIAGAILAVFAFDIFYLES